MGAVTQVCCSSQKSKGKQSIRPKPEYTKELSKQKQKQKQIKSQKINFDKNDNIVNNTTTANQIKNNPQKQHEEAEKLIQSLQKNYPVPHNKINWDSFEILHKIGSGGFGQVFLGKLKANKNQDNNQKYAIKRIPKSEILKRKLTSSIQLEKKILQESKCNFITTLHYAFRDQKYLYLVMEFASGGDTYTLINQKSSRIHLFKASGENAVRFILGCIILGMEYLHNHKIMFRDLKPENVLMFDDGYIKLTDFGLAKEIEDDKPSKTQAGTTIYYAPQMVLRQGYTKFIDLWTIGIFAYEMSNYNPPFAGAQIKDRQRVKKIVIKAQKDRVWKNPNISEELKSFINGLLMFDPKQRLGYNSWDEIKNHAFFTKAEFNWKDLQDRKIQSPLKALIQHYPMQFKPYVPPKQQKQSNNNGSTGQQQFEGWTLLNNNNGNNGNKKQ